MSVYVDDMYRSPIGEFGRGWKRMKMSHLMADTTEELLAMTQAIDLNWDWRQNPGQGPSREHFDVSMTKRKLAIAHGAIPMTMRELTEWRIAKRAALDTEEQRGR